MKHRTFFWFFLPTGLAMLLFIAFADRLGHHPVGASPRMRPCFVRWRIAARSAVRRKRSHRPGGDAGAARAGSRSAVLSASISLSTAGIWRLPKSTRRGLVVGFDRRFLRQAGQPSLLPGNGVHADLHLRRHAASDRSRLDHRAGGQLAASASQGAGDLLFAAADDRDPADRLAGAFLDGRQPRRTRFGATFQWLVWPIRACRSRPRRR